MTFFNREAAIIRRELLSSTVERLMFEAYVPQVIIQPIVGQIDEILSQETFVADIAGTATLPPVKRKVCAPEWPHAN